MQTYNIPIYDVPAGNVEDVASIISKVSFLPERVAKELLINISFAEPFYLMLPQRCSGEMAHWLYSYLIANGVAGAFVSLGDRPPMFFNGAMLNMNKIGLLREGVINDSN